VSRGTGDRPVPRVFPGKVPWETVSDLVSTNLPASVRLGPAVGEDAALIEIRGELWAVAADPITFTAADAGRLAVLVNANDVAVRGARPSFFVAVVMLAADKASAARVRDLLSQIRETCRALGVALIGGHTEIAPSLKETIVVGTMLGRVQGQPITTGGLKPGDRIGLTRHAGLEGSAILAHDLGPRLAAELGREVVDELRAVVARGSLSVVEEALAMAAIPGVTSLHDVTEGGVGEALHELARASGLILDVDISAIPVPGPLRRVCEALSINPLGLIGSGAVLVGCTSEAASEVEQELARHEVPISWIGRAGDAGEEPPVPRFPRDELLKVSMLDGIEAVVFDMDGTLVDSEYDWPEIRRRLRVTHASIIDELNGLPEPERGERWRALERIEATASEKATLKPGVHRLLEAVAASHFRTALVTNNSRRNTGDLLGRFGLEFDAVLTRDDGVWKPSGKPFLEAASRLGVTAGECFAVGDSRYDVEGARAAGCGVVAVVHEGVARHRDESDLAFDDLAALELYLRLTRGL